MSDLVKRLRGDMFSSLTFWDALLKHKEIRKEAADRIEELEAQLKNDTAHEFYESSGEKPPESL